MIETIMNFDGTILLWIQDNLRILWLNPIMIGITTLGNAGIIWIAATAALLISKKTRRTGVICLTALALSLVINNIIIKNMVARERPFQVLQSLLPLIQLPTDYSFPSGHSAASFCCGWTMFRTLPKKMGVPALILAVLIAFSRLYVGVHYPSDVAAGVICGILISYLAEWMINNLLNSTEKRKECIK